MAVSIIQRATTVVTSSLFASGASITYRFGSNTTVGNAILVIVPYADRSLLPADVCAAGDTPNGLYGFIGQTPMDRSTNAYGWSNIQVLGKANIAGGALDVTVNVGDCTPYAYVLEIGGVPAGCFDQINGAVATSGTSLASGSVTDQNANDLLIAVGFDFGNSNDTFTGSSGFTQAYTDNYNNGSGIALDTAVYTQSVSSTGPFSNTIGINHTPKALHSLILSISDTTITTHARLSQVV